MITATIGKIFLEAYNKKHGTNYDAKSFFDKVYYPLFFDDKKYLMTAGNTPLENPKISWGDMLSGKKPYETSEQRKQRLDKLMSKFEIGYPTTDNSIGFASIDVNSTTSGQTSSIQYPFVEDDIYYSWFGAGLGIGTQDGLSVLFSNPEILLDIFDGWILYRKVLSENDKLKGNQIIRWNGQWLVHKYDKNYYFANQPLVGLVPDAYETKNGEIGIAAQTWTKVLIGLARHFETPKMMGYVYRFDKTNTTIGFIPFNLEHIRRPIELYQRLFGEDEGRKAEELWGTENGFRACCQKGAIGIEAMQPKGLKQYMTAEKGVKLPKYDEKQIISFHTYQIWLLAMLNNQEMWDKSLEFAKALKSYAESGKKGRTTNSRQIDEVLGATNKRSFMEALSNIASDISGIETIQEIAMTVNSMPTDNVPYFLTLVRFHAASLNNPNNK